MNVHQIKAVFDSLDMELQLPAPGLPRMMFSKGRFFLEPDTYWYKSNPKMWKIYEVFPGSIFRLRAEATDEFELQEWLINECTTS